MTEASHAQLANLIGDMPPAGAQAFLLCMLGVMFSRLPERTVLQIVEETTQVTRQCMIDVMNEKEQEPT